MKKKIFSLLLALCMAIPMAFSLVACDNDDSSSGGEATKQSTMSSENITLSYAETVYDGTEKKPAVTLKYDDEIITSDNYNVDYLDNINAGTATVVVSSKDNSSVLDAGLIFSTTFKINRAPIAVRNAAELNAAIMITDANHVIKLANNISARDAQDKVIPIVIFPGDKDIDVAIDLAGYDINSHISVRSKHDNVVSTKLANVNIFNSSNEESVVGGTTSEVDYALRVFSNNNFNINLENVKFKGFWGGFATNGTYCSETVVNAKNCEFVGTKVGAVDGYDASVGAYLVSGKFIYNFKDCKFEGFGGYYTKTGHHFLDNCEVIANAEYAFPKAYHGNGGVITGSAIMIDSCSSYNQVPAAGYQKALTVDISGGRYVSASNYALEEFSTYSNIVEKVCYAFVHVTNNPLFEGNATTDRNWYSENLGAVVGLNGGHTHVYSSTFFSNETHHYQKCDCGAKRNEQLHNWNDGEIFRVATIDNSGLIEYNCTICGKEKFESYAFGEDRTPVYVSNLAELNAAIAEADINHVIVLTQDISGTDPYVLVYPENSDLNIAIDLAGYDINSYIRIVSKHNSEVTENDVKLYVYNSSESESVVGVSDNSIAYAVQVMTDNAYEIYFKDVTFKAFWGGIASSGNNVSETTVNAYNSKFISTKPDDIDDCGVGAYLVSAKHIYTFDNCEFVGYGAYYTKNGHHNLINCTMTANGTPSYVPSYNGSGANVTASALVIDSCEGYNKGKATGYETDLTVDIVGGTYSSVSNYAIQEYSTYKVQANRVSYAKVTIVDAELIAKDGFERAISFENTSALDSHTYANASDTICDTCGAERELATYDIWNGTIADAPLPYNGVVTITTAEQLAGFAKAVNEGRDYKGVTVVLAKDINLNNFEWTPIGYGVKATGKSFAGTFDGQNHVIYNLKITKFVGGSTNAKASSGVGLFGFINKPAIIKNVVIDGARVDGNHYVGSLIGYALQSTVENCSVTNATINCVYHNADDSGDKAGALIGHAAYVKANTISATNSVVKASRDAGQVVGCIANSTTLKNASASNVNVLNNETGVGEDAGKNIKNEVVGRDVASISLWNGTVGTLPEAVDNVITIRYASEFAAFAKAVNEGNTFEGYTIKLSRDMDLDNIEWTPIGYGFSNFSEVIKFGASFRGTFDGQNKVIYNLKVTTFVGGAANAKAATGVGLFGHIVSAEIKNVKVTGAEVVGNHYVGVVVGFSLNSHIDKCVVKTASASCVYLDEDESGDKVGIIVGQFARTNSASAVASISNCSATSCSVDADRDAGKLIGCLDNVANYTNCTASKVTVSYNESGKGVAEKTNTNISNAIVGRMD